MEAEIKQLTESKPINENKDKNKDIDKKSEENLKEQEAEEEKHKQEEIEKSHNKKHTSKEKDVNKLVDRMQHAKTVMIVDIKGLPSKQFQEIKKSIREHAQIQVAKKNILKRAIEKFGKEDVLPLEKHIKENSAIAISELEGYELAGILAQKKTPAAAKAGQVSTEDIEVKAGPTDLVPGPAISELGAVGLQIAVEDGKLSIKNSKVIVTKGQTINQETASILQKLNIMPFTVGLEPVVIYDVESGKIYTDIKIDSEETKTALASAAGKALGFAQKIVYYCKETIGYFLAKANANNQSLVKLAPVEEKKEEVKEEKTEEAPTDKSSEKPITDTDKTQIKSEEEK
jgi:large subunit ribosomal protein L10